MHHQSVLSKQWRQCRRRDAGRIDQADSVAIMHLDQRQFGPEIFGEEVGHALICAEIAAALDLAPRRFGRVVACDGGLIEVSGLGVPIGTICTIAQGASTEHRAETIGFRNGHTMMMMLGDTVLLRPGAIVRPEGQPGMLAVGPEFLGRAVDGSGEPIDGRGPVMATKSWPAGGYRVGALDRSRVTQVFDSGIRSLNALTTFGINRPSTPASRAWRDRCLRRILTMKKSWPRKSRPKQSRKLPGFRMCWPHKVRLPRRWLSLRKSSIRLGVPVLMVWAV